MDISVLQRDKNIVLNALYQDPSGSLIAKEDLKIIIPARYEENNPSFATITESVYALGIFAIVVGNHYAVNNMAARVRLFPTEIEREKIDDADHYILHFDKGATITDNINVVKEETIGYYIYNYFISLGKVPWFMSALDILKLFESMPEYSGKSYGASHTVPELIISMIMRDENDIQKYWRQTLTSVDDLYKKRPDFIPLSNVPFGARNTTAKLMGSYFDEGLNSALLYPSETTERVEALLRQ